MAKYSPNFFCNLCSLIFLLGSLAFASLLFTSTPISAQSIDSNQAVLEAVTSNGEAIIIYSSLTPLEINKIHSWVLVLNDGSGKPVENAEIAINGGMPEHDHGLPTAPQVTRQLEAGRYLVEGVRFHMPGLWQIFIDLNVAGEQSTTIIDLEL